MSANELPRISLLLSSVGFKGNDIDALLPPFATDYETTVGLKWFPCATGPETWVLEIVKHIPIAVFVSKLAELIAADVYSWLKTTLKDFFADRPNNFGSLVLELEGVTVVSNQPIEVLTSTQLATVLIQIDSEVSKVWEITYDESTDTLSVTALES